MAVTRLGELDALRGLMLVLMTVTHLPTRLSSPLGQPLGYVSAAEGFVLLSAFMAGLVYGRAAREKSIETMGKAFWRRALKVYACHIAILLFVFTVIAFVGLKVDQPAVTNLINYYLNEPLRALIAGAALLYKPPLLDILPMYVLFMLASPLLMSYGLRRGWRGVMALSVAIWLAGQFGLGQWLYNLTLGAWGAHLPFSETGAFGTFGWQFLWVMGLWMGASRSESVEIPFVFPHWAVGAAVVIAVAGLFWRHAVGQIPFADGSSLNIVFDKWQLGPMRLINLFALSVLVIRFGPALVALKPRWPILEKLGSASLPVFAAHLLVVFLVLAVWGDSPQARSVWSDGLLLAACFALLYLTAEITLWLDRTSAKAGQAMKDRKIARANKTPKVAAAKKTDEQQITAKPLS